MSGVDYDARGTGLVRVAHDAGAYYFRVANRAVVGELIRAIEAGGGDIRATPTFRRSRRGAAAGDARAERRGGGVEEDFGEPLGAIVSVSGEHLRLASLTGLAAPALGTSEVCQL